MLQIVLIAILTGISLIVLDTKTKGLRGLVSEGSTLFMKIIEIVCRILPLYILSSLTILFWEEGMTLIKTIWKPIVLCAAFCMLLMIIKVIVVSVSCKASVTSLLKKTFPGFLIGLTTASSTAAYGVVMESNEKELGVEPGLNGFGTPVQMIISVSTMSTGFIAIVYYLAEYSQVQVSPIWFVATWIIVTILSASMPPVSGGPLVCLSIMLAQAGIPAECLGIAGTLAIICDFIMTATRLVISQMELVLESKHWGTLDYEKIRA